MFRPTFLVLAIACSLGLAAVAEVAEARDPRTPIQRRFHPEEGFWKQGYVSAGRANRAYTDQSGWNGNARGGWPVPGASQFVVPSQQAVALNQDVVRCGEYVSTSTAGANSGWIYR